MAAVFTAHMVQGTDRPQFSIHIGGFTPRDPDILALLVKVAPIPVPSLHVYGQADTWVPPSASEALGTTHFAQPQLYPHAGGHYIPTAAADRAVYAQFLGGLGSFA
jgi:hypothetical protein